MIHTNILTPSQIKLHNAHQFMHSLFSRNPELAHTLLAKKWANWMQNNAYATKKIKEIFACTQEENELLKTEIFGQEYANPVGLAAGFSKEFDGLKTLENMGFGYVVAWTVTGLQQDGNKKPRIQRADDIKSLFNWMWLPGSGREALAKKAEFLKKEWQRPEKMPVWISLGNGNNANTQGKEESEESFATRKWEDLAESLSAMYDHADVFEVNVSCPNVHGGTSNQGTSLDIVLELLQKRNQEEAAKRNISPKTIVIKISPLTAQSDPAKAEDITLETLEVMVDIAIKHGVKWITATNTSRERNGIENGKIIYPNGWMSGAKLYEQSLNTVQQLRTLLDERKSDIVVNGVGGIGCEWSLENLSDNGLELYDAGANTLQIYSWLVAWSIILPVALKKNLAMFKEYEKENHK